MTLSKRTSAHACFRHIRIYVTWIGKTLFVTFLLSRQAHRRSSPTNDSGSLSHCFKSSTVVGKKFDTIAPMRLAKNVLVKTLTVALWSSELGEGSFRLSTTAL